MDRLLLMLAVVFALAAPPVMDECAQPVFFSLLFPQLVPRCRQTQPIPWLWDEWCVEEAVRL